MGKKGLELDLGCPGYRSTKDNTLKYEIKSKKTQQGQEQKYLVRALNSSGASDWAHLSLSGDEEQLEQTNGFHDQNHAGVMTTVKTSEAIPSISTATNRLSGVLAPDEGQKSEKHLEPSHSHSIVH